jgi:DNA-binding NtrC family response regulator
MSDLKRIFVVDDDRQVLRYLTELLQESGYDTVSCERFLDAKGMLATSRPDLLLTDLRLGAYNGLQLAIFARERHPGLPVIVLTGYEDPTLRDEAVRAGAHFLVKPVTRAVLLDTVTKALAGGTDPSSSAPTIPTSR